MCQTNIVDNILSSVCSRKLILGSIICVVVMNNFYWITEKVFYHLLFLLPSFLTGSDCGYLNV